MDGDLAGVYLSGTLAQGGLLMRTPLVVHHLLEPNRSKREQEADVRNALEKSGGDPETFVTTVFQRPDLPGNPYQLTITAYAKELPNDQSSHN